MKSITVLFKNTLKHFKKRKEKGRFLNSLVIEAVPDLEIRLYQKLESFKYKVKDVLNLGKDELTRVLKSTERFESLFVLLQEEINKRELDIDLKKYPAFKDYELKNEDKLNYLTESFNEKQQRFPISM